MCAISFQINWISDNDDTVLPFDMAKSLVNSFVISRIDYCNGWLVGV